MLRFPAPSLDRHTVPCEKWGVAAHLQMGREGASKRISAVPDRTALRPSIYGAGMERVAVHQKGHQKRAGEAGEKARFEGLWRSARRPGPLNGGPAADRRPLPLEFRDRARHFIARRPCK